MYEPLKWDVSDDLHHLLHLPVEVQIAVQRHLSQAGDRPVIYKLRTDDDDTFYGVDYRNGSIGFYGGGYSDEQGDCILYEGTGGIEDALAWLPEELKRLGRERLELSKRMSSFNVRAWGSGWEFETVDGDPPAGDWRTTGETVTYRVEGESHEGVIVWADTGSRWALVRDDDGDPAVCIFDLNRQVAFAPMIRAARGWERLIDHPDISDETLQKLANAGSIMPEVLSSPLTKGKPVGYSAYESSQYVL